MRPTTDHGINIESTLDGERKALSLDENSLTHIMSLLTDLYSDPALAVIREYSTNAWDSHIEAGNVAPIEITLPAALSPVFIVRDYGVGLSRDEILNVYSKYGASTKRNSDDVVGMLGLGCKSALTYTDQFTVVAVKDCEKTLATVSRTEDGGGEIEIDEPIPTGEPDGVEIQVPIRRGEWDTFAKKAHSFFQHWAPGTVLVNGVEPKRDIILQLTPDIAVVDLENSGYGYRYDYLVMGNVSYPIKDRFGFSKHYSICATVPIGSLNITPSREDLYYKGRTMETIQRVKDEIKAAIDSELEKRLAAAKTHVEALEIYADFRESFTLITSGTGIEYQGTPIIEKEALHGIVYDTGFSTHAISRHIKSGSSTSYGYNAASINLLAKETTGGGRSSYTRHNTFFVTGFVGTDVSSYRRKKIKHWLETNGYPKVQYYDHFIRRHAILVEDNEPILDSPWCAEIPRVDWDTIDAIKLPRNNNGNLPKTSTKGLYDVSDGGGWVSTEEDDVEGDPIAYISLDQGTGINARLFKELFPDGVIVKMGKNRIARFLRLYDEALPYQDLIHEGMDMLVQKLSTKDKVLLHLSTTEKNYRALFEGYESQITSPEVKVWMDETSGTLSDEAVIYQNWTYQFNTPVVRPDTLFDSSGNTNWLETVTKKYPMLTLMVSGGGYFAYNAPQRVPTQHLIDYINKV